MTRKGWFDDRPTSDNVTRREFNALVQRVASLESMALGDQSRHHWAGSVGDNAYYHRQGDISGTLAQVAPWVSTTTRFSERLTSIEFVKATAGQAALLGITFAVMGTGAAWVLELPWVTTGAVCGVAGATLSLGLLIALNRAELHSLVSAQADKGKRRSEMRVQIDHVGDHGIKFLYLNSDITSDQLREFAIAALGGASLTVHKWTGQGALFTRGQFDDLMGELETMGYIRPARGNVARSLNRKGQALMRGLSENG
jgi:hypothetical protein